MEAGVSVEGLIEVSEFYAGGTPRPHSYVWFQDLTPAPFVISGKGCWCSAAIAVLCKLGDLNLGSNRNTRLRFRSLFGVNCYTITY